MSVENPNPFEKLVQSLADLLTQPGYADYFAAAKKRHGARAIIKQAAYETRRPFTRALIRKFAGEANLGVGTPFPSPLPPGAREIRTPFDNPQGDTEPWDLPVESGSVDLLFSEGLLQRAADPIRTLKEWRRVLKPGGHLALLLPHCERCLDFNRQPTRLARLIKNHERGVDETDTGHLTDWRANVADQGLARELEGISDEELITRRLTNRHVWFPRDATELLKHAGLKPVYLADRVPDAPQSFAVAAQKPDKGE